jgi:hypothetical protein
MVSAAVGASDQGVWVVYTLAVRQLWCGRGEVTTLKVEEEVMYFTRGHHDTSTILLPMGLTSIGNISMLF